jgi:carbamoyl-phosphate synthase large subunit
MIINILITSSGNNNGIRLMKSIIKNSKFKNLNIFGADINETKYKNIFLVPSVTNKTYFYKITKIIKDNQIDLIIPGSDEEAIFFSKLKNKIEKYNCKVCGVNFKYLKKFTDKKVTYQTLTKNNIRSATWFESKNYTELNKHISNLKVKNKEIVIKPVFSRGGRNVTVIRKNIKSIIKKNFGKELHMSEKIFLKYYIKKYKKLFPLITMERLYEPAYDLDLLCWKGKVLKTVVRKRLGSQGINGCIIEFNKKEFINYSKEIVKVFNLSWLYDCDIMMNKDNLPVLIELNPRISGSLYASIESQIPLIDDVINLHLGNMSKIKNLNFKKNITIKK